MSEQDLIHQFPYTARKEKTRRPIEDEFPDSPVVRRELIITAGIVLVVVGLLIWVAVELAQKYN